MDPNANLAEQRALTARILSGETASGVVYGLRAMADDAERLAELAEALDEWITRGGFLPRSWEAKR